MNFEHHLNGRVRLANGDSRDVLHALPDNSIDSVVTDPPYALVSIVKRFGGTNAAPAKGDVYARAAAGFMGQTWDTGETAFAVEFWAEVMRVLKPGGHVIAASGTRTYHRLAVAIEDAGFEIRDMISWLYGSGFPKSHDVSKGIAKRRIEDVEPIRAICRFVRAAMDERGFKSRDLTQFFDDCNPRLVDHWAARDTDSQPGLPTPGQWATLKTVLALSEEMDAEFARLNARKGEHSDEWTGAEVVGELDGAPGGFGDHRFTVRDNLVRAVGGDAAEWSGWGTALKPACEPWVLARKPLAGTVAGNVLAHGTGALNIDGCRVAVDAEADAAQLRTMARSGKVRVDGWGMDRGDAEIAVVRPEGRWPANVIHDGSDEVVGSFPIAPGQQGVVTGNEPSSPFANVYGDMPSRAGSATPRGDSGTAARFFYTAKADAMDRIGSKHPTVKPLDLMQYLCRLVTPPGGVVLDPFAGTGTTGEAAWREGFQAVLIEREAGYAEDIRRRLSLADQGEGSRRRASAKPRAEKDGPQASLFS